LQPFTIHFHNHHHHHHHHSKPIFLTKKCISLYIEAFLHLILIVTSG
jgi:hypothetical protein